MIAEHAATLAAGHLINNAQSLQIGECGVDGWCGQTCYLNNLVRCVKRILLEKLVNTKGRPCSIALHRDPLPIFLEKIDDLGRSLKRLIGSVGNAGQEKV